MTDLLDGRALDSALAEVQGWRNIRRESAVDAVALSLGWDYYGVRPGDEDDDTTWLPLLTLDLIAAAEEPLVKAGWELAMHSYSDDGGVYECEWFKRLDVFPIAVATAPTEKIARGNATYRALLKLKEEQG